VKHPGDKSMSRLGGTAAHEYERLILAGPNSMRQFPKRLLPAINQAVRDLKARHLSARIAYTFTDGGLLAYTIDVAGEIRIKGAVAALLQLRGLLASIDAGLAMDDLPRRVQVFQEMIRLYFLAFLVPMLRSDGVSRAQSGRSSHGRKQLPGGTETTSDIQAFARHLWQRKMLRANAVKKLAKQYDVTPRRASAVCAEIGWHGRGLRTE
jgi:hypothetical protein